MFVPKTLSFGAIGDHSHSRTGKMRRQGTLINVAIIISNNAITVVGGGAVIISAVFVDIVVVILRWRLRLLLLSLS